MRDHVKPAAGRLSSDFGDHLYDNAHLWLPTGNDSRRILVVVALADPVAYLKLSVLSRHLNMHHSKSVSAPLSQQQKVPRIETFLR